MNHRKSFVMWFGPRPEQGCLDEFIYRDLSLHFLEGLPSKGDLSRSAGAVVVFNKEKLGDFQSIIKKLAECAEDYSLITVVIGQDEDFPQMTGIFESLNWFPTRRLTSPQNHEASEIIARHDPQEAANLELQIELAKELDPLDEISVLLLQRAFWDCKKIELLPLFGGRTAKVFQVDVLFKERGYIHHPLPFFAKIGDSEKIQCEHENFKKYVEHYIPFHLRPYLDSRRSIFGTKAGIIVGCFVEKSEPLRAVIRRGEAASVIPSIFLESLANWREQATPEAGRFSLDVFTPVKISPNRLRSAQQLGLEKTPDELLFVLNSLRNTAFFCGIVHGDLHDRNIRVRKNDAILIDFAKVKSGPIVADCAALEISLIFEHDEEDNLDLWKEFVTKYYSLDACLQMPAGDNSWQFAVVDEMRKIVNAKKACDFEYPIALAHYLLNRATYPSESDGDEVRKTHALLIAEKLIKDLEVRS